jgi:EmrB/QacA subfamily drug resistance transporter
MEGSAGERLDRAKILALAAMAMAVFVIANDFTALSVALPDMESDFDSDVNTIQWVINAYALIFGVMIVTGGRLADMFGRRRMFFLGAAIFAGFSVLGGAAQSDIWLILCRALMGIGGALMWPAVLGMTYDILPDSKAGLAGGLILGAAGFGNAAGPLFGGFLTDQLSWRWVLFANLPIALAACWFTWRAVRDDRPDSGRQRIDYAGIATLSTGLIMLLLALDQMTTWGVGDPRVIALLVLAVVLVGAFVVRERGAGDAALVPGDVMRSLQFRIACLATLCMSATFFVAMIYLPQFMQKILDYDPFKAGLGMLPLMAVFAATSFAAGTLYERLGPKLIVSLGAACLTAGTFLISLIDKDTGWAALVPAMVVLGVGVGLFYSSVTTVAVTSLDPSRSSLAGGLVYMFQIAGGSLGIGLATLIFTTASQDRLQQDAVASRLSESAREDAQGILAGTESGAEVLARLGEAAGFRLIEAVRDSFASGMQWSFRVVAAIALVGLVMSILYIGRPLFGRAEPRPAEGSTTA